MSKEMDLLKRILATGWLDHELSCEVEELLAQPETEQEPVEDRIVGNGEPPTTDGDPDVYTSSPMTHREAYLRGYEKAVCALKREPLSDAQIAELWGDKHSGKTYMVKNFARAIEKAHGIGVDDE